MTDAWHQPLHHSPAGSLGADTAQTPGMAHSEAAPGDYVYVPPFTPHREENPSADEDAVVVLARSTQEAIVVNVADLTGSPLPPAR